MNSITTKKGSGPPKVTGYVEGGSFGTFNQAVGVSGSQDRFNYAFNVSHMRYENQPVTPAYMVPPGGHAAGNAYDNKSLSTKLGYDVDKNLSFNMIGYYTDAVLHYSDDTSDPIPFGREFSLAVGLPQPELLRPRRSGVDAAMMDGRLKTLHPKIHGGLLALRDNPAHTEAAGKHGIEMIDMVVINLYAFEDTVAREGCTLAEAIENVDIGGPTMLGPQPRIFTLSPS